jgi:ABC-type glutathione transport system ATPase component
MQDVGQLGTTVLFVSHNMPAVARLCNRVVLMEGGGVIKDGPTREVISAYLSDGTHTMGMREWNDPKRAPGGEAIRHCSPVLSKTAAFRKRWTFVIRYWSDNTRSGMALVLRKFLLSMNGIHVFKR